MQNIIHSTIEIDEILGESSSSEDGSDVSPPTISQHLDTQNVNNEREYSTKSNDDNGANNQIEITNHQKRNVNAQIRNF